MSNTLNYKFIGWCHDDNSDKVWGVIYLESLPDRGFAYYGYTYVKTAIFWGKRGGKLQTKICQDDVELYKTIQKKRQRGYTEIDVNKLSSVYPEFEQDLAASAMWAMLKT